MKITTFDIFYFQNDKIDYIEFKKRISDLIKENKISINNFLAPKYSNFLT